MNTPLSLVQELRERQWRIHFPSSKTSILTCLDLMRQAVSGTLNERHALTEKLVKRARHGPTELFVIAYHAFPPPGWRVTTS